MAKGKKKRSKGKPGASWEAMGAAMLATLGNTIGQLIADGAEHVMSRRATGNASNGATTPPPVPQSASPDSGDLTATILRQLDADGERSIADVISAGGAGLTATLEALSSAREFGLIEFEEGEGIVRLTDAGRRTVAALSGEKTASEEPVEREESEENAEAYPE